jgi:hypothetical protein
VARAAFVGGGEAEEEEDLFEYFRSFSATLADLGVAREESNGATLCLGRVLVLSLGRG